MNSKNSREFMLSKFAPQYTKRTILLNELNFGLKDLQILFFDDCKALYGTFIVRNPEKIREQIFEMRGKFQTKIESIRIELSKLFLDGHPILGPNYSFESIIQKLSAIRNTDKDLVYLKEYKAFKSHSHGSVIGHFFYEMFNTPTNKTQTTGDRLKDSKLFFDDIYRIAILKKLSEKEVEENKSIATVLPAMMKYNNGNQRASNFPVLTAKWIYETVLSNPKYEKDKELIVTDFCMGWGARLAALLSVQNQNSNLLNRDIKLLGTDVNTNISKNYHNFLGFWREHIFNSDRFSMYQSIIPAEEIFLDNEFEKIRGKAHLMFTSPPYFNKEMYSDDRTQSYIRYQNYLSWRSNFLEPFIQNASSIIRDNGEVWINIARIKKRDNIFFELEDDTKYYASKAGLKLVETYKMLMPIIPGSKQKQPHEIEHNIIYVNEKPKKFEPIFRFIKG